MAIHRARFLLAALLLLSAGIPAAFAFVPSADRAFEVPGPYDWTAPQSAEITAGRDADPALDGFQARYGGTWRMIRNDATGTAAALYGSGIALAADGRIDDASEAESISREFVDQNPGLLGVTSADLVLGDAAFGLNKWGVNFYQSVNGLRVERSKLTLVFHASGRLYAILNETYPDANVPVVPALSREAAASVARSGLAFQAARDTEEGVSMSILPMMEGGRIVLHLAYRVDLKTAQPYGLWSTYVDAEDGRVLWRRNNYESFVPRAPVELATEVITGTVSGIVPEFNPCDGDESLAFRNQRVKEVGVANSVATDTSLAGNFALTVADSTPRLVDFLLTGKSPVNWITVLNQNGPRAADTLLASPAAPADLFWDDTNSRKDERSAWVHGNRAHDFIKSVDPTFTGMDFTAQMRVNNSSSQANCPGNAQWTGNGADFCAPSGSFGNTGEIGDVVYHEYGHGVNSTVYSPFGIGALSEGAADVLANFINEDPIIGDGFFAGSCGIGIRTSNNALVLADTLTHTQIHDRGQIGAGFWWELRGRLIESHSELGKIASPDNRGKSLTHELWHWCRRLTKPNTEIPYVLGTFIVDDDDGNLSNGTPNYSDICDIATQKGFSCPSISQGVSIAHTALQSTTDTTAARTVAATVTSLSGGIDPSTVELNYRVNGGSFTTVGMTDGGGGSYSASIPAAPEPTLVEYYIAAEDSAGEAAFSPTAAQDATPDTSDTATPPLYTKYHAYDVCKIYDACEAVGGWTPHLTASPPDSSTATGGIWENGAPGANLSQPGYQMTPGGANCFVTGAGTGNVNNGITILLSPVWDLANCDSVVVKLRRWFVNDQEGTVDRYRQDYFITDISNDSGQTFVNFEATNEGLDSWQEREYNLTTLFGTVGKVRFKFTVQDTGAVTKVEGMIDEVRITAKLPVGVTVTSGPDAAGSLPGRFALHANVPNPFNPSTLIRFDLPKATFAKIAVFNAGGERVRALVSERRSAGSHAVPWNGRNDRGEEVGSGVYFFRLTTPEFDQTRKMLLVK